MSKTSIRCPRCNHRQTAMSMMAWRDGATHNISHTCKNKECDYVKTKKGRDWMKFLGFDKNGC